MSGEQALTLDLWWLAPRERRAEIGRMIAVQYALGDVTKVTRVKNKNDERSTDAAGHVPRRRAKKRDAKRHMHDGWCNHIRFGMMCPGSRSKPCRAVASTERLQCEDMLANHGRLAAALEQRKNLANAARAMAGRRPERILLDAAIKTQHLEIHELICGEPTRGCRFCDAVRAERKTRSIAATSAITIGSVASYAACTNVTSARVPIGNTGETR